MSFQVESPQGNTVRDLFLWSAKTGLQNATQHGLQLANVAPGSRLHYKIVEEMGDLQCRIIRLQSGGPLLF